MRSIILDADADDMRISPFHWPDVNRQLHTASSCIAATCAISAHGVTKALVAGVHQ